jgi:predicted AAA+ superfamily ATPase
MAFVSGPRQVGKTTVCRDLAGTYLNWDDEDHRALILAGPGAVAEAARLGRLSEQMPVVVFDELHKYRRWKSFLKGFFDTHSDRARVVVTGSSRLDVYRRGGDSLMGRYLTYRLHPLSVGELLDPVPRESALRMPKPLAQEAWDALWTFGGYPEPLIRRDLRFARRWQRLRADQLVREEVRDTTAIQDLDQLAILVRILAARSGCQVNHSALARDVRTSVDTVRRWISVLSSLFHGFLVRPWFRNVARGLRKEPKWYLRDWSTVEDPGGRAETFVACHLLKAVEGWEDAGLGAFELRYLRDKEGREVDFVVVRDGRPWFLVEVKRQDDAVAPALRRFQEQTGAPHAFQVVVDAPFVAADPFERSDPCVVPARTLLAELP